MSKFYLALAGGLFLVFVGLTFVYLFVPQNIFRSSPKPSVKSAQTSRALVPETRTVYKTNSWFSSAYTFPSEPMFAYPGAYKVSEKGLEVSVPQIKVDDRVIFGSFDPLCALNWGEKISSSKVVGYGDWNVSVALSDSMHSYTASLVQGLPYVYLSGDSGLDLHISCTGAQFQKQQNGVLVRRGDAAIFIQSSAKRDVMISSEQEATLGSGDGQWRIVVLPDSASVELFSAEAWNPVIDTQVSWAEDSDSTFKTTYAFLTQTGDPVVTTIWPHQGRFVSDVEPFSNKSYRTVLGELSVVKTSGFSSVTKRESLPFSFTPVTDVAHRDGIVSAIRSDSAKYLKEEAPGGVYFKGTWIGALSSLVQLADVYGLTPERDQLLERLSSVMTRSLQDFSYDEKTHMFVALHPEFGNEKGNDHHFHYGYYIRAAAILKKYGRAVQGEGTITEMVNDISSFDRKGTRYPFLRSYSPYEGHSWADGEAHFGDGNDQESTSEALNAWYAVKLWGVVTGDFVTERRGEWLFSQELAGTRAYWFGVDNSFPSGYNYPIASLVWGGKREFNTWFSGHPMHVVGIQLLPITPASGYLAETSGNRVRFQLLEREPQVLHHEWADLYLGYTSYFDPVRASGELNQVESPQGMKLTSLLYQTVYRNQEK
jgi:endoglucanase Acf2